MAPNFRSFTIFSLNSISPKSQHPGGVSRHASGVRVPRYRTVCHVGDKVVGGPLTDRQTLKVTLIN